MPNIIKKLDFQWSIPQKEAAKGAEAKKTTQYLQRLHFWIFEVKEAVEVIMTDGAKEATEGVRFT